MVITEGYPHPQKFIAKKFYPSNIVTTEIFVGMFFLAQLQPVYTRMQIRINSNWFDFARSLNANRIELIRFRWYHLGLWYSNQMNQAGSN